MTSQSSIKKVQSILRFTQTLFSKKTVFLLVICLSQIKQYIARRHIFCEAKWYNYNAIISRRNPIHERKVQRNELWTRKQS